MASSPAPRPSSADSRLEPSRLLSAQCPADFQKAPRSGRAGPAPLGWHPLAQRPPRARQKHGELFRARPRADSSSSLPRPRLPCTNRSQSRPPRGMKLFLGGISPNTPSDVVKQHFSKFGPVADAVVMRDRGFGSFCGGPAPHPHTHTHTPLDHLQVSTSGGIRAAKLWPTAVDIAPASNLGQNMAEVAPTIWPQVATLAEIGTNLGQDRPSTVNIGPPLIGIGLGPGFQIGSQFWISVRNCFRN